MIRFEVYRKTKGMIGLMAVCCGYSVTVAAHKTVPWIVSTHGHDNVKVPVGILQTRNVITFALVWLSLTLIWPVKK